MLGRTLVSFFVFSALLSPDLSQAEALGQYAETPILKFHAEKDPLKVGEAQTIFVQANVGFTKNEVVLESFLDDARVEMSQTAPSLWILSMNAFTEVKSHLVEIRIFVRNAQEAGRIRDATAKLNMEIASLNAKIELELDEAKRNALIALRDNKQAALDRLDADLSNLKVLFKSETYSFAVQADPNNTEFPQIVDVQPNVGALAGGTVVQISGTNFPESMINAALPIVKFGGVNASVASAAGGIISAVTPSFADGGTKDLEVSFPSPTNPKNAIKQNAFFATSGNAIATNFRPVAVTNGYQLRSWPNPGLVTLVGSGSYDENEDQISHKWVIKAVAKNSVLVPGTVLSTQPSPVFTPDKKGVYVFELRVQESGTPQSLESLPNFATVEVN